MRWGDDAKTAAGMQLILRSVSQIGTDARIKMQIISGVQMT